MKRTYKHLSRDERVAISVLLNQGLSVRQIAGQLGRNPATVSRELKRNGHPERVSHETIYQWVYREARDLIPFLARSHPKRLWRGYRKQSRIKIPARVSIHDPPRLPTNARR